MLADEELAVYVSRLVGADEANEDDRHSAARGRATPIDDAQARITCL
jgi:hypothetical protein